MASEKSDETLTPNYDVIDAHLDRIDSGSSWVLTSVEETGDKTTTHTATFGSPTRKQAHKWIADEQAAGHSVYIHYNAVKGRPKSKPKKEAVIGLSWLYVDLDPAKPPEGCADVAAHYAFARLHPLDRGQGQARGPGEGALVKAGQRARGAELARGNHSPSMSSAFSGRIVDVRYDFIDAL